jgi:hypothetical protein
MAKAAFGTIFLGDGLVWLGSDYERMSAEVRRLLWSTRADIEEGSANFFWRVRAVVWARRADTVALATALETLAMSLGSAKADLKVYADDGVTLQRTYPSCRFDGMTRREGPGESRRDFEDDVVFLFTTDQDPE